jgi:hypothetical protein
LNENSIPQWGKNSKNKVKKKENKLEANGIDNRGFVWYCIVIQSPQGSEKQTPHRGRKETTMTTAQKFLVAIIPELKALFKAETHYSHPYTTTIPNVQLRAEIVAKYRLADIQDLLNMHSNMGYRALTLPKALRDVYLHCGKLYTAQAKMFHGLMVDGTYTHEQALEWLMMRYNNINKEYQKFLGLANANELAYMDHWYLNPQAELDTRREEV